MESAQNGQEAVDLFKQSQENYYSAVLMDIRMPVMNGLEAAREIRTLNRNDVRTIPIIAMSANAFEEDVQQSLKAGMNEHLAKPVNQQNLYSVLSKYLK